MRATALVVLALTVLPACVGAQSPIMRPKQTAQRAVNRTNAHTAAMTDTSAGRAATASNPAPASSSSSASAASARNASAPNGDTTKARVTTSTGATAKKPERTAFEREIFAYERSGRRDPFISLMQSSEIRPMLADLRLVGVAYDPTGRMSVAVLREDAQDANAGTARGATRSTADVPQYRVREGQQIGRMRVARIGMKSVTFTIEEFGYSRQETLTLSDSNTEKKP